MYKFERLEVYQLALDMYLKADEQLLRKLDDSGQTPARKLQAMRKVVIRS